jgi:hypothetical protein
VPPPCLRRALGEAWRQGLPADYRVFEYTPALDPYAWRKLCVFHATELPPCLELDLREAQEAWLDYITEGSSKQRVLDLRVDVPLFDALAAGVIDEAAVGDTVAFVSWGVSLMQGAHTDLRFMRAQGDDVVPVAARMFRMSSKSVTEVCGHFRDMLGMSACRPLFDMTGALLDVASLVDVHDLCVSEQNRIEHAFLCTPDMDKCIAYVPVVRPTPLVPEDVDEMRVVVSNAATIEPWAAARYSSATVQALPIPLHLLGQAPHELVLSCPRPFPTVVAWPDAVRHLLGYHYSGRQRVLY